MITPSQSGFRSKISTICATVAFVLLLPWSSAAAAETKMWLFSYDSGDGNTRIYLSPTGTRVCYLEHLNLLSAAPSWQLCYFSPKRKLYFDIPLKSRTLEDEAKAASYDFRKAKMEGKEIWCGVPTLKESIPLKSFRSNGFSGMILEDTVKTKEIDLYETTSLSLPVPAKAIDSARGYFSVRQGITCNGLPLGAKLVLADGKDLWLFKLRSIKQLPYDPALFIKPKGLAAAKNMTQIYLEDNQSSAMSDLAEDMDLGRSLGSGKKK